MIKLSPRGGGAVSGGDLGSNFFRQVFLNRLFNPGALPLGAAPAGSPEAKQTGALAYRRLSGRRCP